MEKKYKICYVTTLPVMLKNFIEKSAIYLIDKGSFDVCFICDETDGFDKQIDSRITYIPVHIKRGISLSAFQSIYSLYKVFKEQKFDLVQYCNTNAGVYASIAARLAGIQVRIYSQWGLDYPAFKGFKRLLWKTIEKIICSNSTNIQPDSKENLQICFRDKIYSADKGNVICNGSANGVDLQRFDISKKDEWKEYIRKKYDISDSTFVFGYVGRLLKDKGINEMFDAFDSLHNIYQNTVLVIVGDKKIIQGISKEKIEDEMNKDSYIFVDYTTEVEKYIASFDCLLLPSYHEGFGNVIIESEALSVPVIASDIPGPREALKNQLTGLLVPCGDSAELFNAMKYIYEDDSIREEFGSEGHRYVSNMFEQSLVFEAIYNDRIRLLESI